MPADFETEIDTAIKSQGTAQNLALTLTIFSVLSALYCLLAKLGKTKKSKTDGYFFCRAATPTETKLANPRLLSCKLLAQPH